MKTTLLCIASLIAELPQVQKEHICKLYQFMLDSSYPHREDLILKLILILQNDTVNNESSIHADLKHGDSIDRAIHKFMEEIS